MSLDSGTSRRLTLIIISDTDSKEIKNSSMGCLLPCSQPLVGDDGEPYYWNTETDQTQYEKPDGFVADERSERAPTPTPTDTPAKANPQTTSQGNGRFIDLPGTVSVIPGSSLVQTSQNLSTKVPKKVELSSA